MSLTLVIGNKNYSSWSLRPWIALKQAGIAFEEVLVPIYVEGAKEQILARSPAGKVPVLQHDGLTVWDSLSILEYLAEAFPDAGLWPQDRAARALARSISAEMHSGFVPLRKHYTMNLRRRIPGLDVPPEVGENISRVQQIWRDARVRHAGDGPFLFGAFSAADAMYAPVVTRFETYAVDVAPDTRAYMDAVLGLPAMREWYAAARIEPWTLPQFEM